MYIRWQTRKVKRFPDDVVWTPVLVQSKRVNGKPVQQHVAYLGSFRNPTDRYRWCRWWDKLIARLDVLNITPKDRKKVEAAIAQRIPRPVRDEHFSCR